MSESSFHDLTSETRALLSRHNLLKAWVRAEITATAVQTIAVPEEEGAELWNRYLKEHNIKDDDALGKHLQQIGLSAEDLHWQLELPQRIRKYSQEHFQHKAEARFLARKDELDRVVYSLLRVNDGFLARELYLRIAGSEANFQTLLLNTARARKPKPKESLTGSDATGPPCPSVKGCAPANQDNLEPFNIEQWWLVARLERYEARFDTVTAEQMTTELFQEWVQEMAQDGSTLIEQRNHA